MQEIGGKETTRKTGTRWVDNIRMDLGDCIILKLFCMGLGIH
jgi:hypothetical protein